MTTETTPNPAAMRTANVPPRVRFLAIQEDGWADDILARAGKVWTVYAYDRRRHVYCCELQPSYECHPVGVIAERMPDDDGERERLWDDLQRGFYEGVDLSYRHVRDINRLPTLRRRGFHAGLLPDGGATIPYGGLADPDDVDPDDASDAAIQEAIEYARCNGFVD